MVKDTEANEFDGAFTDWKLTLWGESADESRAKLLPMPTLEDDADHDSTTTMEATTTAIDVGAPPTSMPAVPTDHPDRPVNEKPSGTEEEEGTRPSATSTSTSTESASATPSSKPDNFLPSFFPTFGVSKKTQIWIYGAATIIVLFCIGLGAYFIMARRKRLRNNPRDDYEFEMLEDAEDQERMLNGRRGRKRAGELYDAFAGESDEELISDEEEEYHDEKEDDAEASGVTDEKDDRRDGS